MEISLVEKCKNLKNRDIKALESAVSEIITLPNLIGIVQVGSSTYSENYHDIDVLIFFDSFLVPPELDSIRKRYKRNKLWLEGASIKENSLKFNPGYKVFIKTFSNIKSKKILYGKDPYTNKRIVLKKTEIAAYIWYGYHACELYGFCEGVLPNSLRAMLTYKNKFPEKKEEILEIFRKEYPGLVEYLPINPERYLRETNKSNFKNLYKFFEESLRYFAENKGDNK